MAIRSVVLPSGPRTTKAGWGKPRPKRVIPDGVAYQVTQILEQNMTRGTGTGAYFGRPAAGKTGTTDDHTDAWFVRLHADSSPTAVWVGYPNATIEMTSVHGISVSGGSFPATIWNLFMSRALANAPVPTGRFRSSRPSGDPGKGQYQFHGDYVHDGDRTTETETETGTTEPGRPRQEPGRTNRRRRPVRRPSPPSRRRLRRSPPPPGPSGPAGADEPPPPDRNERLGHDGDAAARLVRLRGSPRALPAAALAAGVARLASWRGAVARGASESSPLSPDHVGGDEPLGLGSTSAPWRPRSRSTSRAWPRSRDGERCRRRRRARRRSSSRPLAGPVLLSTDVYTYWAYGRVAAVHGENPTTPRPRRFRRIRPTRGWAPTGATRHPSTGRGSRSLRRGRARGGSVGRRSRRGPLPGDRGGVHARADAARRALARRRAFAAAFVGWNPLLAVHFAGGGHNDALMMALVLGAIALAAAGGRQLAGVAWAASIAIKWVPAVFLVLRALEARARDARCATWASRWPRAVVAVASWRYGAAGSSPSGPLAATSRSRPSTRSRRLSGLGCPRTPRSPSSGVLAAIAFAVAAP